MAEVKKGTKIAERKALNAKGEDQSDYTEAVRAEYVHLESGATVSWDFAHIENPVERAFAIDGFLNKAGHAVNKARNGGDGDVPAALAEFLNNAKDGGWTNREGGNEINLAAIQAAFAELRNATIETVQAAWEGYTDEQKKSVRANPQVKALVAEAKARKARAAAEQSSASPLPEL